MTSFSIEAPAEANPLTNQSVYQTLQAAASSDQHQIQTGTKQLQNWETSPGFYSTLQVITPRNIFLDMGSNIRCSQCISTNHFQKKCVTFQSSN